MSGMPNNRRSDRSRNQRRRTKTVRQRAWRFDPSRFTEHISSVDDQRKQLVAIIDEHGFDWQVFAVAASGFFTDSYNLFASNVILPCLAFVYWPNEHYATREISINVTTLVSSAIGQVLFGFMADKYGRQRLYGVELVIVIVSTIALAQSSVGVVNTETGARSMSVEGWILLWRFVMGIGIGAEYPLSACITAEWSATKSRARMMSAVFLMQPLGQVFAYIVGLSALTGLHRIGYDFSSDSQDARIGVDILWRIVTGVGAVPALIALLFRFSIPESGRYTYDVKQDSHTAMRDTRQVYSSNMPTPSQDLELETVTSNLEISASNDEYFDRIPTRDDNPKHGDDDSDNFELPEDDEEYSQFTTTELWSYFIEEGNWRYLAGTCISWFLLDFAYYGLSFNNSGTMAKLWTSHAMPDSPNRPTWLLTSSQRTGTIYDVIVAHAKECILTISIASIAGSILVILTVNRFNRQKALIWSFVALATALLITAVLFIFTFHTSKHWVLVVWYALVQFGFSFGPNTLTFIIPAEIFPTRYRCTAYGIAAASGKLGSVLVQVAFLTFDHGRMRDPNSKALGYIIFVLAGLMLLGAIMAWAWVPSVQQRADGHKFCVASQTLEQLGVGRHYTPEQEQVGFRNRFKNAGKSMKRKPRD